LRLETLERGIRRLDRKDFATLVDGMVSAISRREWPPIRKLELVLTEDCNLRCDYCWIPKRPLHMSWEVARQALEFLFEESRDAQDLEITLFGGEPLLAWDVFAHTVEHAEQLAASGGRRIHWAVTTNGTLLNEKNVRFASMHGINYLLSLDGDRRCHDLHRRTAEGQGSFDLVVRNVPMLKRLQGWLGTRMTVNPDTVASLASNIQVLAHMGINQFLVGANPAAKWDRESRQRLAAEWVRIAGQYVRMRRQGWPLRIGALEAEGFDQTNERRPGWGCEAGQDKVAVAPSGDIYPCSRFLDVDWLRNANWLGHVDRGLVAVRTRRSITDSRLLVRHKCMTCRHRDRCNGSCPATNWLLTGSPFVAPTFDCEGVRMGERLKREVPEAWEASKIPFRREPLPLLGDSCAEQASPCGIRPLN